MKKKVVLTTIVAAMLAVCMLSLTACAGNVAGNTYVFSDITYKYSGDMTDEQKANFDKIVEGIKSASSNSKFTLEENGDLKMTVKVGTWTQDGNKVTMKSGLTTQEYTVKGSKLVRTYAYENDEKLTITITYKKA